MLPRTWFALALGVITTLALLSPLAVFALEGRSLVGLTEEGIGYRYFYPLRMLYGDHERPWLFFGQLNGLACIAVQLLLTALGYPPTQLFPRVDVFAYLAAGVPHVLSGLALAWAVAPLASRSGQVAVAALFLLEAFSARANQGLHLVDTKYWSWVHPVALVTLGWLLRIERRPRSSGWRRALGFGLMIGACLALKPSYLVFPFMISVALALHGWRRPSWLVGTFAAATVIGGAMWLLTIWLYYLGDLSATLAQFSRLPEAVANTLASPPLVVWLAEQVDGGRFDVTTIRTILPLVLALGAALLPRKKASVPVITGLLVALWIAYRRPGTEIETNDVALVALVAWWANVLAPWVRPGDGRRWPHLSAARSGKVDAMWARGSAVGAAALALGALGAVAALPAWLRPVLIEANAGARQLMDIVDGEPGRTLFAIPTNEYRPITIDAALQKGGMNTDSNLWMDSPLVASMVPNRWYVIGSSAQAGPPLAVPPYERLVFTVVNARGRADAERAVEAAFGVALRELDCDREVRLPGETVVICRRPR